MRDYRRQLEEILSFFISEREKYSFELQKSPEGSLGFSHNSKQDEFLWRVNGRRMGIGKNPDMIRQLARKEYIKKILIEIDGNIRAISNAISNYRDINPRNIIESMRNAYARLAPEMFFVNGSTSFDTDDEALKRRMELHREWAEQPYEKNQYPFGPYDQWTSRGLHVRSQKEQVICEIIYQYEIPFRYDQVIHIGNNSVAPDFTFQQHTGDELYLEYCGMMDNEEYVEKHLKKRKLYEQAGIYEWDNIIYIYTKGRQLNTQLVDSIIRYQILPRM